MRIALGSDLSCELTTSLERRLRGRGCEPVTFGALASGADPTWPSVGRAVGEAVADGDCAQGILCCWTGTGVAIAANKVAGVRAALCNDAQTARGARTWNDANVLVLSIRSVTPAIADEILDAWFAAQPSEDEAERKMIDDLKQVDEQRCKQRARAHARAP